MAVVAEAGGGGAANGIFDTKAVPEGVIIPPADIRGFCSQHLHEWRPNIFNRNC